MVNVNEVLLSKYYNRIGYIVSLSHLPVLISLAPTTAVFRGNERLRFSCRSSEYLSTHCLVKYDEQHTPVITLYVFVLICFPTLWFVCIIYSLCCVKSKVDEVETALKVDAKNPRRRPRVTSRLVFISYILHLFIRFLLGIMFACLQKLKFYPAGFPTEFTCLAPTEKPTVNSTNSNATKYYSSDTINCDNSIASDKALLALIILVVNVLLAASVFGEMSYLLVRAFRSGEFTWDSEFCRKHLWDEKTHSIIVNQVISSMKEKTLRETETKFANKVSEEVKTLLRGNTNTENLCRILVEGRSRTENSLLCEKISHHWAKNLLCDFDLLYLIPFRWFNKENLEKISLKKMLGFLHPDGSNDELFQYVLDNSEKVIILFNGLDEYIYHSQCKENDQPYGENEAIEEMPPSALYVKLVTGELLSGATVLTTSKSDAVESIEHLSAHYRKEEMLDVADHSEPEGKPLIEDSLTGPRSTIFV